MAARSDGSFQPGPGLDGRPALEWLSRPDGAIEFVSRRWHDYTGLSSEESYGVGCRAVVHPEDIDELLEKWGRVC